MKWPPGFGSWLLAAGIAGITPHAPAGEARIAVAAEAATAEAPISEIAARAPHILIFDAAGTMVESHPNPAATRRGGAGPALAGWLAEQKVGTLIAGDFGAKLAAALRERKIKALRASGPAALAVKDARR